MNKKFFTYAGIIRHAEKQSDRIEELEAEVERLRYALEIIAGQKRCIDPCMGNMDVALAALAHEADET